MTRFTSTERIGINKVEEIFLKNGWIPRLIFQSDVGVDMEVEVVTNGVPTGQLFGIQIKSGKSYFKSQVNDQISFPVSKIHGDYWIRHSLPIVIVLHNPSTGKTIWQNISESTLIRAGANFKIRIPLANNFDATIVTRFLRLTKYPPYIQRLQRLAIQKSLIQNIKTNERTVVEVEEWVNKSIGKAKISIKKIDYYGNEDVIIEDGYIHFKGIADLEELYPWAQFNLDEDFYEDNDNDVYNATYGGNPPISFAEFRENLPQIRAIDDNGEVSFFRFEITLNKIGKAFLKLNRYLEGGMQGNLKLKLHKKYTT